MNNELDQYIKTFLGLTGPSLAAVSIFFQPATLKKGEYYLTPGKVAVTLSFLRHGMIRFYIVDESGQEVTQWIACRGDFVADLSGLIFNTPARFYMQALTDCELYTIHQADYNRLGETIPKWHHWEKLFIARCFLFMEDRIFSLLSMKAEERYQWFFRHCPTIFNEAPLQYLASMMGMSPETLSRIRRRKKTS